jgi:hypothetical protein
MPRLQLKEVYRQRPVLSLGIAEILTKRPGQAPWRLKVYGIAYDRPAPREELVAAAMDRARHDLPPVAANVYGLGFLGVHDGRGATLVFLDWWADENELHHRVYVGPPDRPGILEDVTHTDLLGCCWDLAVIAYERQAWVETMLANPAGPDEEAYLARRLEGLV